MKLKFTLLTGLLFLLFGGAAMAQSIGDFESNGTGGGLWTSNTTWQIYNGSAFVPAGAGVTPDATSGIVTILSGDLVILTSAITIDQVVVNGGGTLLMGSGVDITLNNNPVNMAMDVKSGGVLTISTNGRLLGAGTLLNEAGGTVNVVSNSAIGVNTTNNGTTNFTGPAGVEDNTFTNNSVMTLSTGNLLIGNAGIIINNDIFTVNVGGSGVSFASYALPGPNSGTFINSGGAVINLTDPTLVLSVAATIAFTNSGTIEGVGTFDVQSATPASTGTIMPGTGASAQTLTEGQTFTITGTPNYSIGLFTTGAVAGTNYSQLVINQGGAGSPGVIDVSSSKLTITDHVNSGDAPGTVYTVMAASGAVTFDNTKVFASTSIPATLSAPTVTSSGVTVTRIFSLPLTWGPFTVTAAGNQSALAWTTLQESNVKDFTIERSSDAVTFTSIGTVKANGNTHSPSNYSFTDPSPSMSGYNYYRLAETDLDGKKAYSVIDVLSFGKTKTVLVQTSPNPVRDMLNITVQADNLSIMINSMNGTTLKTIKLNRGFQQASMSDLPAGAYNVIIYQGDSKIDSRQIVKF